MFFGLRESKLRVIVCASLWRGFAIDTWSFPAASREAVTLASGMMRPEGATIVAALLSVGTNAAS